MDIQELGLWNETSIQKNANMVKNAENNFKELFEKLTGGELAEMIRDNYNVTLNVGGVSDCQQMLDINNLRGTNYVIISPAALSNMENNLALKEKVMGDIEKFCSPEQQAEIRALQPPVKSAGMIVYPDGRTLYWLEGYPNELGTEKEKKVISEKNMEVLFQRYSNADYQMAENDLTTVIQIMALGYKGQDTGLN